MPPWVKVPSGWRMTGWMIAAAALALAPGAAHAKIVRLGAMLSGMFEPSGGDSDGIGSFLVEIDIGAGRMCYTLMTRRIALATFAHIHAGARGSTGPAVMPLAITGARNDTCSDFDPAVIEGIIAEPQSFYVNVLNRQFPDGALRGHLVRR